MAVSIQPPMADKRPVERVVHGVRLCVGGAGDVGDAGDAEDKPVGSFLFSTVPSVVARFCDHLKSLRENTNTEIASSMPMYAAA